MRTETPSTRLNTILRADDLLTADRNSAAVLWWACCLRLIRGLSARKAARRWKFPRKIKSLYKRNTAQPQEVIAAARAFGGFIKVGTAVRPADVI